MKFKYTKHNILFFLVFCFLSKNIYADAPKTDLDFFGLPEFCNGFLNPKFDGTPLRQQWTERLNGFDGPHHYCFGIHNYNLALKAFNKEDRTKHLKSAMAEYMYPINHHFNPKHPLSPKLLYDIGKATEALEDYDSAVNFYKQSIELNPNVWLPYAALSDLQIKLNKSKDAIETLEQGLQHKPNTKPLLKRLNKIKK